MGAIRTLKPSVEMASLAKVSRISSEIETPRLRGSGRQNRNRRFLRHNPLCGLCKAEGRVTAAVECDHVIPLHLGGREHESNLQGLCKRHHDEKSAREAEARANGTAEHVSRSGQVATDDLGFA